MGNSNRRRGFDFEREIVNKVRHLGLPAERAWGSNGKSLGMAEDVDLLVAGIPMQAKRKKSLAKYLKPPESCDATVVREDRGETYLVVRLETFLQLLLEQSALDLESS